MIKANWEQIVKGQDIRQNLSKLRQAVRETGAGDAILYLMAGEESKLIELLHSTDAKTRKNAALLLGDLGKQEFLEAIFKAYEEEEQRFVKSSYLSAMKNLDYREYVPSFKERLELLLHTEAPKEEQKHMTEEIRELSSLIVMIEGVKAHAFTGFCEPYDIILLTNRNHQTLTLKELLEEDPVAKGKALGAGVTASVSNLNWLRKIRTYQELLFVIKGLKTCSLDPEEVAKTIVGSELLKFLKRGHKGEPPFYFRIEYKSKRPLDKRTDFAKKLSSQIEKLSRRTLINTTSNYEFEIRVIENKEGNCNFLIKLFTLKEERFSYRKEVIPTSIKPVNAALAVALAKDYMKEGAQVLDPFCGVGTMLIERHKAVPANTTYGIDTNEDAIQKAKVNTEEAHQIIHYINRNFFDFTHEYLFDEIITNMPFKIGRKAEEDILESYERFFDKVREVMKEGGTLILYSHDREHVIRLAREHRFPVLEEYEISKKEGTFVFVLSV